MKELIADMKDKRSALEINCSTVNTKEGVLEVFKYIPFNTSLKKIIIHHGDIDEEDVLYDLFQQIQQNSHVKYLEIQCSCLDDKSAKIIADFLLTNKSLVKLDLSCNHFKNEGAIILAEALKINNTLEYLDLSGCNIGNNGRDILMTIASNKMNVKFLDLTHNIEDLFETKVTYGSKELYLKKSHKDFEKEGEIIFKNNLIKISEKILEKDLILNKVDNEKITPDINQKSIKHIIDKSLYVEAQLKSQEKGEEITTSQVLVSLYTESLDSMNQDFLSPKDIYNEKLQAQIDYFTSTGEVLGDTISAWLGFNDCALTFDNFS